MPSLTTTTSSVGHVFPSYRVETRKHVTSSGEELPSPYGTGPVDKKTKKKSMAKVRIHHLRQLKERGEPWPMLTTYDMYSAQLFDEAGIPVLLVGDSASNNVLANDTTLPITVDEMLPLVRAVTRSAKRALVVADLPFGSYQICPKQALATAIRFMKEGGAHAVKLEGGHRFAEHVETLTTAGVPVMAHIGFMPSNEHMLGGYRIQGRGEASDALLTDALALQSAGAFAVVLEMIPGDVANKITNELLIPTVGIGAGPHCDAQILVWQDMAGLRRTKVPKFVKQYANVAHVLSDVAKRYADDVRSGRFPAPEHTYT